MAGEGERLRRALCGFLIAIGIGLLCVSGFCAGFLNASPQGTRASAGGRLSLVWEAWSYVEQYFYGAIPDGQELVYGAIDGSLETLGDPYTRLVRPIAHEMERDRLRGHFAGIGAYVYEDSARLYLQPLADGPAEAAGVQEGDQLLAVDGVELPGGATPELAVAWIRGPLGSVVKIDVYRPSTGERLSLAIERQEIAQPTVEWAVMDEYRPVVGYIRITLFSERTPVELQRALASLRRDGAALLVLDLRANPGGLLDSAVEVSSRFLRRGVVLHELLADGTERRYSVRPRVRANEPMVVLVDEGTASAAEIVAGALRDHERAELVGQRTRGKGSVQLAYDLSDGSSLHVTSALWLTPNRAEIDGVGLAPDHPVDAAEPQTNADERVPRTNANEHRGESDPVLEVGLMVLGVVADCVEAMQ